MAQSEATITPSDSSETLEDRLLRELLAAGYGSSPDTVNPAMLDIRYQHQQADEQEGQGRQLQQQEQQEQQEQREEPLQQQEEQQQQEQQGLQPAAAQQQQQQAQARQNDLRAGRLRQHQWFAHNHRQRRQRLLEELQQQQQPQQQQQQQPLLRKNGQPRLNPERKVSDLVAGACKTCRKSRTKCQRNPHGGPCQLCVKRGRDCDLNVTDKRTGAAEISDYRADVASSHTRLARRWSVASAVGNGHDRQAAAICRGILQQCPNFDEAYASITANSEAASALSNGDQEILSWDLIRDAQAFLELCRREPQLLSRIRASRRDFVEAAAAVEKQLEQLIQAGCANQEMWEAAP